MTKISVVLPVYNCEEFIFETVASILNQTYKDFELIIVDDFSSDNTVSVIEKFKDFRIKLIKKEKNTGYTDSLNYAISIAKGEYIARMDGDDVCVSTRFEKQVAFLENNPDVVLCGTAIKFIGLDNGVKIYPLSHDSIKIKLCFGTPFCHPSVMGKKQVFLQAPYDKKFEPAEDIHLWSRIVNVGKVVNLDEVLLHYRAHSNQVSVSNREIQKQNSFFVRMEYLKNFALKDKFSDEELKIIFIHDKIHSLQECEIVIKFFKYLESKNFLINEFDVKEFNLMIDNIKLNMLKSFFNLKTFFRFDSLLFFIKHSNFTDAIKILNFKKRIKLF